MSRRSGALSLEDVVQQVADYAIIALDADGVIDSWNLGAERVKGYTADEALGQSFSMFYTEGDRRAGLPGRLLARARSDGRVEHRGWRVRKDGTRFWGDVVITALHDDTGKHTGFAKVTRDLTDQHRLEEALRASEERFRLLVSQVQDYAIIALDPDGVIQTWNLGAEHLKGYTAEEAVGRHFSMFYPAEDRAAGVPDRLLAHARAAGRVESGGWRVRKDGTRFWGDVVITALHDDEGRLTGYAKVTRDRTDLKRLEEASEAFYANFSHDFRTPLTAILGFAEAVRLAEGSARGHMLERIEANAGRLMEMVDDLVEFSLQHQGRAVLELEPLDVTELARSAVRELAPELGSDRVTVHGEPVSAMANLTAMHRVVTNLLVNALKYSAPETGVAIEVARTEAGAARVRVCDQGRGIDEADLATIFNEFERGRLSADDGGTGLGLSSVRELVRQQRGTVQIDSERGVGTTVTVELPPVRSQLPAEPRDDAARTYSGEGQPTG